MSITIGDKTYESGKTTGATVNPSIFIDDNCEIQAPPIIFKKIKEKKFSFSSVNTGLVEEVNQLSFIDDYIKFKEPALDYLYEFEVKYYDGFLAPIIPTVKKHRYKYCNVGWSAFDLINTFNIHMSDLNLGAYVPATENMFIFAQSPTAFNCEVKITISEYLNPVLEILDCEGNITASTLDVTKLGSYLSPIAETYDGEVLNSGAFDIREYDDSLTFDLGTCNNYKVWYEANILGGSQSAIGNEVKYYIDTQANKIKMNITGFIGVSPLFYEIYELFGWTPIYNENATPFGYTDYKNISFSPDLYKFQASDGTNEYAVTSDQVVSIIYNVQNNPCPCACITQCGGELTIIFKNNCGIERKIIVKGEINGGTYDIEGDTFTPLDGQIVTPITKIKANYTLVIDEYSDEIANSE